MKIFTDHAGWFGLWIVLAGALAGADGTDTAPGSHRAPRELNPPTAPAWQRPIAIVGATLIDGRGDRPTPDSAVVVRGERIVAAGPRATTTIPKDAEAFDATGLTLLPGLMDAHFHIERDYELPRLYLAHGVTSVRDPGQWIHVYDPICHSALPQPRCFVAGPHLDAPPHAYPRDAFTVTNAAATRAAVNRFVDEGASHIKVYYRLPLELIRVACTAAHERGVPVTVPKETPTTGAMRGASTAPRTSKAGTSSNKPIPITAPDASENRKKSKEDEVRRATSSR